MKEKRRYDCGALRSCFPIGNALTCSSRSWKSTLVIYESSSRDIATRTHQRFGLDAPMLAVQLNILDNLGNFVAVVATLHGDSLEQWFKSVAMELDSNEFDLGYGRIDRLIFNLNQIKSLRSLMATTIVSSLRPYRISVERCRRKPLYMKWKDCGEAHLSCSLINPEVCFLEGSHARVGGERALKRGAGR